ncbi:MAG: BPL-N domain-containing protein [Nitrospirae bacterium YQR-1]
MVSDKSLILVNPKCTKKALPGFFVLCMLLSIIAIPVTSWSLTGADVAIFNDTTYTGGGAWADGITAIKAMLKNYGYTYEDVTPYDIDTTPNLNYLYKAIIVGGGWAAGYNTYINYDGYNNIRNFVNNGGGYFGICAGAYFATEVVLWREDTTGVINMYDYPLSLFSGEGIGAIKHIKEWNSSTGCSSVITKGAAMTTVNVDTTVLPDVNFSLNILYYGGPFFKPWGGQNVTTVATYQSVGAPSDGYAAMIMFDYGAGKVFLTGPHPEVSFSNCTLWYDTGTWKLMSSVMKKLTGK